MRPLDRLGSIKVKLGVVIVATVGGTVAVLALGRRAGLDLEWRVLLAARPGVVFTREQLLADVWGWRDGSGQRTVDSHVRGLRRKLGPELVRTVHGVGYALEDPR